MSGTLTLRATMSKAFSSLISSTLTSDLYIFGDKIADNDASDANAVQTYPIDGSLADKVKRIHGVKNAYAWDNLEGTLVGSDNSPVTSAGGSTIFMPMFESQPGITWLHGSFPKHKNEVVLESSAMKQSGLKVGSTTHIVILGTSTKVKVVGEFSFGNSVIGATIVGMAPDWIMPLAAPDGKVSGISIDIAPGFSSETIKLEVSKVVPAGVRVQTRLEKVNEQNEKVENILGFVQTFLLAFVVIAMFVSSFIIMNSFAMNVRQRIKEFALLRAVGASSGLVFCIVLLQAITIGLIGSALGIIMGAILLNAIISLLHLVDFSLLDGLEMNDQIIKISLLVGTVVTIVGGILPARRAALTPPVEALRSASGIRETIRIRRTYSGMLFFVVGLVAIVMSWISCDFELRRTLVGIGSGGVLFGVFIVSPTLTRPVMLVLGFPFCRLSSVGHLALRSVVCNPYRTASTSNALMVGMALVCTGATLAASFNASTADQIDKSMKADLVVQPDSMANASAKLPKEMASDISNIDGIESSSRYSLYTVTKTLPNSSRDQSVMITVFNPNSYPDAFDVRVVAGNLGSLDATHVAVAKSERLKLGESVTLSGPNGVVQATVVAIVDPSAMVTPYYASPELAARVGAWNSPRTTTDPDHILDSPNGIFITLKSGANVAVVRGLIKEVVAPIYQYSVRDAEQMSGAIGQRISQMLAILYALLGFSVMIAILGIVNTLALSIVERTREIGLMQAVGVGRRELSAEIAIESIMIALYGTILGVVVGVGVAAALCKTLENNGLAILVIPWNQIVGVLILAVVVGVVAPVWPARRALRIDILKAIG